MALIELPVDIIAKIGRATEDQPSYGNLALTCVATARIGRGAQAQLAKEHFKAVPFPLDELPRTLLVQSKFRSTPEYPREEDNDDDMTPDGIEVITVYCLRTQTFCCGEEDYNIRDYFNCNAPGSIVPSGFTGMIWSYSRENNGYCIFDPYVMPIRITRQEALAKYPGLDGALAEYNRGYYNGTPEEFRYWEVSIARVDRIIDYKMYDYDAERRLSRAEASRAVKLVKRVWRLDHGYCPSEEKSQEMIAEINAELKQLGVVHADDSELREDGTYRDGPENWNFSFEVNSPWVFGPQKPFPDGFEDSHDGCYVKCKCTSRTGQQFEYTFWGD